MDRRSYYGVATLLLFLVVGRALFAAGPELIGTVHLTAGWATFGQAVPQGKAFEALQVGSLPTQTDVKNRWPADNSIKFAIVTVQVPDDADYSITAGESEPGDFLPVPRNVSVDLTIEGVPYVAVAPIAGGDAWLTGPLVREVRHVVAPMAGETPHAFLRVNFDTRIYSDGEARVDVSVENMLNLEGATTVTYDVAVSVDGAVTFSRAAVEHYYLTRWRHTVGFGAFSTVTPDIDALNTTKALPRYLPLVADREDQVEGDGFDILREGALQTYMPGHSGRPELAPYPDWAARYLVHKRPSQKAFVLAHGDLSGSWPIHVREPEAGEQSGVGAQERLVSLDQRPLVWLNWNARDLAQYGFDYIKGLPLPLSIGQAEADPGSGQSPLNPDNAHQPSIAYVPYLLTGDRFYAEEMAFWANYGMIRTGPDNENSPRGGEGILENNEVRGVAWALRNLVDAAAYYPDASSVRQYLAQRVMNNLAKLELEAQPNPANPLTLLWVGRREEPGMVDVWEQIYIAFAIDRANKQGFIGGLAHRDAIARLQLMLFNSPAIYPRTTQLAEDVDFTGITGDLLTTGTTIPWGAPYLLQVANFIGDDPSIWGHPENYTLFTSLEEISAATQSNPFNHRPYAGFYGPEARMGLMIGIEKGFDGAQEAYDYLFPFIGEQPYIEEIPDLALRAGWALDFYPAAPTGEPDNDADDDGYTNEEEIARGSNPNDPGSTPEVCDGVDNDLDGAIDEGTAPGGDSACDFDPDSDGDGFTDDDETAAGSDPNNDLSTPEVCNGVDDDLNEGVDEGFSDSDGDGQADCVDTTDDDPDRDGVLSAVDNCPNDANTGQTNTDGDGQGDACDADDDNDGRNDDVDPRPLVENRAPTIESPGAQTSTIGLAITAVSIVAVDLDTDTLTWTPEGLPQGLVISQSGVITGTPAANAAPQNQVKVTVSDGLKSAFVTFAWAVNNTPIGGGVIVDTPQVDITFSNVTAPGNTQVTPAAPPVPGQVPSGFSVTGLPAYNVTTDAQFTGPVDLCFAVVQPDPAAFALLRVLHAEGGVLVDRTLLPNNFAAQKVCARVTSFSLFALAKAVPPDPAGPELTNPGPQSDTEGDIVFLRLKYDTNLTGKRRHNRPRFSATGLPQGLYIGNHEGVIFGKVSRRAGRATPYNVTVTLEVKGQTTSQSFPWTILEKNHAPHLKHLDDQESKVGQAIKPLKLYAFDQDEDDTLTFSATGLPLGLNITPEGLISGTPTKAGVNRVTITVTDERGATDTCTFEWRVKAPKNHKPQLKHFDDQESKVGDHIKAMKLSAYDPDEDDVLTFTVTGHLPPGLTFDGKNMISGTIGGNGGEYQVTIAVSDGRGGSDSCTFEWKVKSPKKDPKKK